MKFKLDEDWDFSIEPTDTEVTFRRELDVYKKAFFAQPIYLACPQYTYEIEIDADKIKELLDEKKLKIRDIYETTPVVNSSLCENVMMPSPTPIYELNSSEVWSRQAEDVLSTTLYMVDGDNAYRLYIPLDMLNEWLRFGVADEFVADNSQMIFEKLKRLYLQQNQVKNNICHCIDKSKK